MKSCQPLLGLFVRQRSMPPASAHGCKARQPRTPRWFERVREFLDCCEFINTGFLSESFVRLSPNPRFPCQFRFVPLEQICHLRGPFIEDFCNIRVHSQQSIIMSLICDCGAGRVKPSLHRAGSRRLDRTLLLGASHNPSSTLPRRRPAVTRHGTAHRYHVTLSFAKSAERGERRDARCRVRDHAQMLRLTSTQTASIHPGDDANDVAYRALCRDPTRGLLCTLLARIRARGLRRPP